MSSGSMEIFDLLPASRFAAMVSKGYVRLQEHPTEPLTIANYSPKAAYEQIWNEVTLQCRGLIFNDHTNEVVARPFSKFFNYLQAGAPELDLSARVSVTEKIDGSLGILHALPSGGWAIATRGSFASNQALHATELLHGKYPNYEPPQGMTVLFEIIYPANRIVCDYGDMEDLVLLGAVDIATGRSYSVSGLGGWPGPSTKTHTYTTFAEALAAPPRLNAEGLVVHFVGADERLKLKQDDYVALHRLVTGLNARTVWQHLVDGKPIAELIEPLPDELHPWVREAVREIENGVVREMDRLDAAFWALTDGMPSAWILTKDSRESRRVFAERVAQHPDRWAMFCLLDGKNIRPELLRRARPEAYLTPSGQIHCEATA